MPELPDVELFKRHLDTTCLGRTVRQVTVSDARILSGISPSEAGRRLCGVRLAESRRHGKYLLAGLDPPGCLTLHFGMNGSLKHFAEGESDPPYDRLRFDFATATISPMSIRGCSEGSAWRPTPMGLLLSKGCLMRSIRASILQHSSGR
jgi:formamidopyrimidine-DNA glycosylase